ncbi:MAG: two-component regulator propeller domain-containing protein [Salibacteraceae bacterium]
MRLLQLFFGLISFTLCAQPPVGSWSAHLPMNTFDFVGELNTKVFAANQYGILVYDRDDQSKESLTKVNGLSQTNISAINCNREFGVCVVGYSNGNIDIIWEDKQLTNQPALKNNQGVGDKVIREIIFIDDVALLITGIGILELSLSSYDILEYSRLGFEGSAASIFCASLIEDQLYFTTENGVFYQNLDEAFTSPNPVEIVFPSSPLLIKKIFEFRGNTYALLQNEIDGKDTLYGLIETEFQAIELLANSEMRWIDVKDDQLLITGRETIKEFDEDFNLISEVDAFFPNSGVDARQALFSRTQNNEILVADGFHGAVLVPLDDPSNSTILNISSPKSGVISAVKEYDGIIYGMAGGNDFTFITPYFFQLDESGWTSKIMFTETDFSIRNLVDVAVYENRKYLGFDGSGLMILNKNNEILEHYTDSTNQISDKMDGYYGVRNIQVDQDGNVWMLNNRSSATLSLLDKDGQWHGFSFEGFQEPSVEALTLLSNDMLVFSLKEQGMIIYDPGSDIADDSDDRFVNINSSPTQGNLPSNEVVCFVEDRDGELWIGTGEGIAIIFNPESAFEEGFETQRIIVSQDGFNGYLFESDKVNAIHVDGANRKWVAPRGGGLFLISEDGQEQLARFTEDDSPLLSDEVFDLAIQPETGELFIATDNGLLSYRSNATEAEESLGKIKVFPNPVKPGYSGLITFNKLTENSYVRITDAAGNLIFETKSEGGSATWDGKDRNGQKVSTGVYLVFAATQDGAGGSVAKLLFLN